MMKGGVERKKGVEKAARYLEATQRVTADDFKPSAMPITKVQSMKGPHHTYGEAV